MIKTNKKTEWSILDFYSRAWEVTKKHKKLWIVGFALTIFAAGGSGNPNFNLPDNFGKSAPETEEIAPAAMEQKVSINEAQKVVVAESVINSQLESQTQSEVPVEFQALAAQINNWVPKFKWFADLFTKVISQVSPLTVTLLVLEIIAFFIYSIIYMFIARNWAKGLMMAALDQAFKGAKEINLGEASQTAVKRVGSMIWLEIVPSLIFVFLSVLAIIGGAIVFGLISLVVSESSYILILGLIVGTILFIYFLIQLLVRLTWANWHCILSDLAGGEAFSQAKLTTKGTKSKVIRLGFVNTLVKTIVALIVLSPLVIEGFSLFSKFESNQLVWQGLARIGVTAFISIMILTIINAILQVFVSAAWYQAYKTVTNKQS